MTTVISRHTSTISLVSQNPVQLEAGLLVQCLNRHKEYLEYGCEKVLNSKFPKKGTGGTGFDNITSSVVRRLDSGARESLGQHLIQLLATIVLPDPPQSINEVDTRLIDGLPGIPDKLMPSNSDMENYRAFAEKGRKKMLNLPFDKIFTALKEFSGRFNSNVCIYIVAIAEHVIGNFLQAAICYEDKALTENVIRASTVEKLFILYRDRVKPRRKIFEQRLATANLFPQDYDKCVDELCSFLHTSLEQMNLLIRVFREPILLLNSSCSSSPASYEQQTTTTTCTHTNEDNAQVLFGNILDVYSNMRILLDTIEAEDEDNYSPNIMKSKNDCAPSSVSSSSVFNIVKPVNTSSTTTAITTDNGIKLIDSSSEAFTTLESIPEKQLSSANDDNDAGTNDHDKHIGEFNQKDASNGNSLLSSSATFSSTYPNNHTVSNELHRHHYQQDSPAINNGNKNNDIKTHPRRLVGTCLIELAEDDSLHAFSQYATVVLDSNSRDCAWSLIQYENYVQELCQLSRSIVHTASLNNSHLANNFISSSTTDFHSSVCSHCQHWDTVVSKPRRRSTSTTVTPSNSGNNSFNAYSKNPMSTSVDSADKVDMTSRMSSYRYHHQHRSPYLLQVNTPSYAINCNFLVNATRYLLPRIILLPIFHFFYFHELIETLHRCAYDEDDRARLKEVLSMLRKTRTTLERDLAKHPWVAFRYRALYLNAVTGSASCPPSPVNYTTLLSPVCPSSQCGCHNSCGSIFCVNCNSSGSNIFNYHNAHQPSPTLTTTTISTAVTPISVNSTDQYSTNNNSVQNKVEEIEKLLSSKDRLSMPSNYFNALGDFVMESRVHLRTESKKSSSEHIAYLFTGVLLICKWKERRSTPLTSNSMQQSVLRIKHRIPLDIIHVTDLPPIVQPNLAGYVGHSDPMTPSLVGAAVLAATSLSNSYSHNNSTVNSHDETASIGLSPGLFTSSLDGSISIHSSIASAGCGSSGISSFPFLFELEYVDSTSYSPTLHRSFNHSYSRRQQHQHGLPKSYVKGNYNEEAITSSGCNDGNPVLTTGLSSSNSALSSGVSVNHIRIFLRTPEEKADWIASLLSIKTYRLFIRYIRTLPKLEVPLRLPSSHIYRFNQPDNMDNIIFETSSPKSLLHHTNNNSISSQHQQQYLRCYQQKKSHEQFSQSSDLANAYDSAKICCFKESMDDTGPSDGEVGEEEEVEGDLIGSQSLISSNSVVVTPPPYLPIGLSSQSSPTTIPSLSSNIDSPTNTNGSNNDHVVDAACNNDDSNSALKSSESLDNVKVMMSMIHNGDSSSTFTLTNHGSNDNYSNTNNDYQTIANSRANTIKSLGEHSCQQPKSISQSPNRFSQFVNSHTVNPRFSNSTFPPQIRLATLDKLIERLTYPTYFDTRLVNCFLLAYRRVTTSDELLDLLIERFCIPDPEFLPEEWNVEVEQGQLESPAQHMLKRFRSGYKKRVQLRVLMFLSRWVRSTRYYQSDFSSNPGLRQKLLDFLSSIQARHLISSVERIKQYLQNPPTSSTYLSGTISATTTTTETNKENMELLLSSSSDSTPTGSGKSIGRFTLNNIHPFKLAEQVTLYEWELYRRIPFWEVESRDRTGTDMTNLNNSKSFSNRFRSWLIYSILSEAHPDDRTVGIQRVIDLMLIMDHMNNVQGSHEAKSVLISAAVYRLRKSFQAIRRIRHYRDIVDRLRSDDVHLKCQRTSSSHQNSSILDPHIAGNHSNNTNNNNNIPSTSNNHFSSFGLPFSTRISKSHERRIRVLEKQHASGESCHPCVPYIAAGVMTRLIHLDLRHPDTIINDAGNVMINCWKHRQLAEIVERYLAFQRIPYTYDVDNEIREFLQHIDPFELAGVSSEAEFESKMYQLSELYEPRESELVNEPIIPEERHMTKEEIQAAHLLSTTSLKERMSVQSVLQFNHLLNSPASTNNNNSNNNNKSPSLLLSSTSSLTSFAAFSATDSNNANEHMNSLKKSSHNPMSSSSSLQVNGDKHLSNNNTQERKYLRIPNRLYLSSHTSNISASGSKHQHSMSDSHVISPIISPYHQAANSVIGVTTAYSAGLSPPSTPHPSTYDYSHCQQPPPPPLPPRQRRQSCNCAKYTKSSNSTINLHRIPTPPSHSPLNTSRPFFPTTESCNCLPPPLPPKSTCSDPSTVSSVATMPATTAPVLYNRSPNESSPPSHSKFVSSFAFITDTSTNVKTQSVEMAPPLPPRRIAVNTTSALSNTVPTHNTRSPDA
ncbi:Protein son of sevenless [Schistosoma japonicum]|uniref:Protein son of sevenless n=1 Tax=Schistosoma japonicum TaxID=6182 RepID=A0A4Z2DNB0_SCHJA|nr:Protein son of sevenless [Schistosoma japonicum]